MRAPVNIFSGTTDGLLAAVLTNPTALAKRKGRIKGDYPITFRGVEYEDCEKAYQENKTSSQEDRIELLTTVMAIKFRSYPEIFEEVKKAGGEAWLLTCEHRVGSYSSYWTGKGINSGFIRILIQLFNQWDKKEI